MGDTAHEDTVRLAGDEPVSNGDLLLDEVEADSDAGNADGVEAAGEDGLEAVQGYEPPTPEPSVEAVETAPNLDGLPDVAEASFDIPLVRAESVIGEDERRQISPASSFPWRAHASLLITARDGTRYVGTGFFIGPRVLATAGHCVFIRSSNPARHGWARSIQVMPGRDGSDLPYGSSTSTRFHSVKGWTRDGDDEFDYGAIVLPDALGSQTGWLGFGAYSDSTLDGLYGNLAGYPADKPSGTQWYMARRVTDVGTRKVYYDIDTFGGQSGSAVYRIASGNRSVFGIHAYGTGPSPFNSATRITRPAFDNYRAWKSAHA